MKPISSFGIPFGISTSFWLLIGIIRAISEKMLNFKKKQIKDQKLSPKDIAAIIPAHNEELVIRPCIQALKQSLYAEQIYVVSDGSSDKTYQRARLEKCHVSRLTQGKGKAKALIYLINHYRLFKKYKLIFIVDADTRIDASYIKKALPLFNDPEISVIFGTARINWPKHLLPKIGLYFIAYRERLNRMLQYFLIYGQTWKYTNVNFVIPGFATIYRSKILRKLQIDTPGLLIEDFNLAFQLHKRRLGKIGYNPNLIGWDQHPDNLFDYWKQVRRWNIGFFQTVRINGIWPSFFWLSLGIFTIEVFLNSIFVLFIPLLILFLSFQNLSFFFPFLNTFTNFYEQFGPFKYVSLLSVLFLFYYDYGMTVVFGLMGKKPQFIIYGLFFFFMHYVTSLILVSSLVPGFFKSSSGRWISPARRAEK